jgi:hypothetical protein
MLQVGLLLASLPLPGMAHGQEAIFLPIGGIAAMVSLVIVALALRLTVWESATGLAVGIAVCVPIWLVRNASVPHFLQQSAFGWLLVGYLPPLTVAVVIMVTAKRRRSAAGSSNLEGQDPR